MTREQQGESDQYIEGDKKQKGELLPGFEPGSREDPDKPIKIPDANLYTTRARIRHSRKIFDTVNQYSSISRTSSSAAWSQSNNRWGGSGLLDYS